MKEIMFWLSNILCGRGGIKEIDPVYFEGQN